MAETAKVAAKRLAGSVLAKGFKPVALHAYTDREGTPIYWRIRAKHPVTGEKWIRPMKLTSEGYELGEPKFEGGKPLYALHTIVAHRDAQVWVVEGEQKADALIKRGFIATTSGGATSAAAADWEPLRSRSVTIWPDFDEAGNTYAREVATILQTLDCTVSSIDVQKIGVPEKGDVIDWLSTRQDVDSADILTLPRVEPHLEACEKPATDRVVLIRGDTITPEPVHWLWEGWLARGKFHVLAGAPGTGKTTIALAIAATLSLGGRWPDSSLASPGNVIVWSGEDDPADTLAPRLLAMGADMKRVHFVSGTVENGEPRPFDPARDIEALTLQAAEIADVRLLIVDPVVSAVSGDSHKNADTRRALQPLVDLAARLDCAVLGISHYSKGTQGRDPVERVTGSIAFGALARVVWGTAKASDEGQKRRLVRAKSNIGKDGGGFEYDLEQAAVSGHPGLFASRVLWCDAIEGGARELLAVAETVEAEPNQMADTTQWLKDLLTEEGGQLDKKTIVRLAKEYGYSERTVQRARENLHVTVSQTGFGRDKKSIWMMPIIGNCANHANRANVCHTQKYGTHGTNGTIGQIVEAGEVF